MSALRGVGAVAPVLYITGYVEHSQRVLEDGSRLLVKPFTMDELRAAIQSLRAAASV